MNGNIEGGNNETNIPSGNREMTQDELDTYFASLDQNRDARQPIIIEEAEDRAQEDPEALLAQLENIASEQDIKAAIDRLIDLDVSLRSSELFGKSLDAIKNMIFSRGEEAYNIGSFFDADIVEDTFLLYPNDSRFGNTEIGIYPETSLQDVGVQLLQGLMDGGTYVEGGENDWDLVTQIEKNYGVNWDEVKEMA